MRSFITGSRAYGSPSQDSDLDLVVLVSEEDKYLLELFSDAFEGKVPDKEEETPGKKVKVSPIEGLMSRVNSWDSPKDSPEESLDPSGEGQDKLPKKAIRYGKLNLILLTSEEEYMCWYLATEKMREDKTNNIQEVSYSTGEAINTIDSFFDLRGLYRPSRVSSEMPEF